MRTVKGARHPENSNSGKSFPPLGPKGQEEEMLLPEFTENGIAKEWFPVGKRNTVITRD